MSLSSAPYSSWLACHIRVMHLDTILLLLLLFLENKQNHTLTHERTNIRPNMSSSIAIKFILYVYVICTRMFHIVHTAVAVPMLSFLNLFILRFLCHPQNQLGNVSKQWMAALYTSEEMIVGQTDTIHFDSRKVSFVSFSSSPFSVWLSVVIISMVR